MSHRTLLVSATNLLARGFLVVPTDRASRTGAPVNGLFAVARALHRALDTKTPTHAVAVVDSELDLAGWPEPLRQQLAPLRELLTTLGFTVVAAPDEPRVVASYARAALEQGDDVLIVGIDKRYAQLVSDKLWWYDASKDVRYTPEIVRKRFGVAPSEVGEWLAVVGDDSGNEELPGVKGLGAKGATQLIEEHGSITAALAKADGLEGRLGKVLRASRDDVPRELARGRLDSARALPVALAEAVFAPRDVATRNALYEELRFVELLSAEASSVDVDVCLGAGDVTAALARMATGEPLAFIALVEDPAPVRAPLAGVACANGRGRAAWVPVGSAAWPELAAWLADARAAKIGHDVAGTLVELRRAGIVVAGLVGDAACASHLTEPSNWAPHDLAVTAKHVLGRALVDDDAVRGVGKQRKAWGALPVARVAAHAAACADAAAAIWLRLAPSLAPKAQLEEYLALEDLCMRMELTGIRVDPAELDGTEASFAEIEHELEVDVEKLAGHPLNINSNKQLGELLFEELKLPIVSRTKTGWSTSSEALERIEHAHPIVPLVMRWRALRRLRDSWVFSLRRCIDTDGRVHSRFHPARSFSGQIVNSNPDLGRVPGRTPEMARIRRAFVASSNHVLMSVDFNQLGLHVLAHLTRDEALVEPLRRRADVHALTAAAVLDVPLDDVTAAQRQLGKVVNFATFSGQGSSALALQLGITPAEAKAYIARFDERYAKVRAFQEEQLRLARTQGYVVTLGGRRWPIGALTSLDPLLSNYAERMARRATHEGSVQDVSRRALLEADRALRREGLAAVPLLQVLDEVLFEVPEAELERTARVCAEAMRNAYVLEVPLVVTAEAGPNWADLESVSLRR